jgi:hypothetical protein
MLTLNYTLQIPLEGLTVAQLAKKLRTQLENKVSITVFTSVPPIYPYPEQD